MKRIICIHGITPKRNCKECRMEKNLRNGRNYQKRHPDEIRKMSNRKWRLNNPDKTREYGLKAHKRRSEAGLIHNPLNSWFWGSDGHHICKTIVVYMPKPIHQTIRHSVLKNRNMDDINLEAWIWVAKEGYLTQKHP